MAETVILITGANSGVGFAATKVITTFSARYHVLLGCRDPKKGEKAKAELETSGNIKGKITVLPIDVTVRDTINKAFEYIESTFGHLDVLINNAAVGDLRPDRAERLRNSLEVNTIGPAIASETFMPLLLKSEHPYNLYVTSGLGSFGLAPERPTGHDFPNGDAYRISKAALDFVMLLDHLKYEKQGLKTFAVCPGFVRSNLRGTDPEAISGGGQAGDPDVSGQLLLDIIEGKRDADVGKIVRTDTDGRGTTWAY